VTQRLRARPQLTAGLLFAAVAAVTRVASYGKPLERDTANYLYVGRLLWHGTMPYKSAATNKAPVTYVFFGFVDLLAGPRALIIRLLLLAFVVVACLAVAAYVERYAGRAAGLAAGVALAVLAAAAPIQGDDPNLEQFGIALMAVSWALATRPTRRAAGASGLALGVAVAANPLLGIAAPFVAWELLRSAPADGRGRLLAGIGAGLAVVVAGVAFVIAGGAWGAFHEQVLSDDLYSRPGGSGLLSSGQLGWQNAFDVPGGALYWLGAAAALVAARRRALRAPAIACLLWIALVWLKTELQSYAFPHHYYLALPAIVAAVGLACSVVWAGAPRARAGLVCLVLAAPAVAYVVGPQFRALDVPADRRWEAEGLGANWRLATPVADFIAARTKPSDTIFMAGADPEVYWLARRRAPTRYFDYYLPLRDPAAAAERMQALEHHPPAAIGALPDGDANADLPAIQPFIDAHGYRLALDLEGAKVWLRPDVAGA
jgi:hypothetical protein